MNPFGVEDFSKAYKFPRLSTKWPNQDMVPKWLGGENHSVQRGIYNTVSGFTGPALAGGVVGAGLVGADQAKKKKLVSRSREAARERARRKIVKSYPFGGGPEMARPISELNPEDRAKLRGALWKKKGHVPYAAPKKQKALPPLDQRGRKVRATGTKDPKGAYRLQRKTTRANSADARVKEAANRAAAAERKLAASSKAVERPNIRHAQVSSLATKPMAIAGGAEWLRRRNKARREGKRVVGGPAVDMAIGTGIGATTGDLGMIAGGWSAKRSIERYRHKQMGYTKTDKKTGVKTRVKGKLEVENPKKWKEANAEWGRFQQREGFKQFGENHPGDRVDATKPSVQRDLVSRYPLKFPGGRAQRLLGIKNRNSVGFIVPVAGAAIAGSTALHQAKKNNKKRAAIGKAMSKDKKDLERSRKVQGALSLGGASIGLAALGTKGGSLVARKTAKTTFGAKPLYAKLNDTSIGLTTLGAGVGGASGIHFYRLMNKENKVHKADERYEYRKAEKAAYEAGRYVPLGADDVVQPGPPAREKPAIKILPKSGGMQVEARRQKRMKAEQYGVVGAAGALAGGAAGQVRPKAIKDAVKGKTVLRSLKNKNVKVAGGLALGAGAAGAAAAGVGHMRNKQGKAYTDWWDG